MRDFPPRKDGERLFVTFSGRVAGGIGMVTVFYRGPDWQADIPYVYLLLLRLLQNKYSRYKADIQI